MCKTINVDIVVNTTMDCKQSAMLLSRVESKVLQTGSRAHLIDYVKVSSFHSTILAGGIKFRSHPLCFQSYNSLAKYSSAGHITERSTKFG
jgi:hypothetical protein